MLPELWLIIMVIVNGKYSVEKYPLYLIVWTAMQQTRSPITIQVFVNNNHEQHNTGQDY